MRVIPILLYHSIADDPPADIAPWTLSPTNFLEHVTAIVDSRRTPMTVSDLAAGIRGEQPLPARPMAVTFDDGFSNTADAVRLLTDAGIPATVYVTTGMMGRPGMLSIRDLSELCGIDGAVEIGAHGVRHRRLDELDGDELTTETADSRMLIEEVTQRGCASFAYPHGNHDRASVAAVRNAGYSSAVAVRNALSHDHDDVFALARVTMQRGTSAEKVEQLLAGRFKVAAPAERLRTRGYRQFRRLRRRLQHAEPAVSR
jgi:peptidoglycan/xylan/chitin deacetylase (PgdA/CDA1 family)